MKSKNIFTIIATCITFIVLCSSCTNEPSEINIEETIITTTEADTTSTFEISPIMNTGITDLYKSVFLELVPKLGEITFDEIKKICRRKWI